MNMQNKSSTSSSSKEAHSAEGPKGNLGAIVSAQVEKAAQFVGLSQELSNVLAHPQHIVMVNFPVKMENGQIRLFQGYRVQHNNILGPYKGGIRYHQDVNLDEVIGLASAMTWKSALHNIPYGGGKGGVKVNPLLHTPKELERITRRFTYEIASHIGPEIDIPAPDVGTNSQTMAWMMDTYMKLSSPSDRNAARGVVTGKPIELGGSYGRDAATGQGLVHCIVEWARREQVTLTGKKAAIQGFGNVGSHSARILSKLGVELVAVGDYKGYIYNPKGLSPLQLIEHVKKTGSVVNFPEAQTITREEFFAVSCDILIPAALELEIGEKEAESIKAKVIVEGANGPTYPEAEEILLQRGITVLPDILVNSGGVMVSYFEWLQNTRSEYWDLEEVEARLEKIMKRTFNQVYDRMKAQNISPRLSVYAQALERIRKAYEVSGIWP